MKKITLLLSTILISGCASISQIEDASTTISSFHKVTESIYRGAKPNKHGLEELKNLGVKTIISLEEDIESSRQKEIEARKLGFYFYSLPINLYIRPTDKTVLDFLDIVLLKEKQPAFIYCEDGKNRTGAIVAIYRTIVNGWGPKEAYKEAKNLGFWPYRGTNELKNFIHQLKDKKIYFERVKQSRKDCGCGD